MSEEVSSLNLRAPDVFSRGSLNTTFNLIRKKNPQLALNVRNITGSEPLPKGISQPDNKNADHFKVELDSFQVRAIVEALMECSQKELTNNKESGMAVMAESLMQDWIALASNMIARLPSRHNPHN